MDFALSMQLNTDNPYKCDLMKEDYIECLHHRKEVVFCRFVLILQKDRENMIEVEYQRQEKARRKEEKAEFKAMASQKH